MACENCGPGPLVSVCAEDPRLRARRSWARLDRLTKPRKERFPRKKYMGVCRWESRMVTRMRTPLPSRITRYMSRMSTKNVFSSFGWADRPRRMNPTTEEV